MRHARTLAKSVPFVAFFFGCNETPAPRAATTTSSGPDLPAHDEVLRRLGGHHFEMHLKTTAWDGPRLDQTHDENATLEVDALGQYHLVHNIGENHGKEVFLVDGKFASRHRYGALFLRQDGSSAARLRQEIWDTLRAQLEVIAHGIDWTSQGVLMKAAQARPAAKQASPERKWRETVQIDTAEGKMVLEQDVPISVTLEVTYRFRKAGHDPRVEIDYTHSLTHAAPSLAMPDEATPTPKRHSLEDERKRLLGQSP